MNIRHIFLLSLSLAAASVFANSLTSVSAAQRWPFNGKVDIDYTLESNTANPVFRVAFFGQIEDGAVFSLDTLEGEGACGVTFGSGVKRITWDSSVDKPGSDTEDAKFGVVVLDVTSQAKYLKLDLSDYKMSHSATGPDVSQDACKTTEIWFKKINAGTYYMGSAADEPGRMSGNQPEDKHQVTITKPFYIGVFECTDAQYQIINSGSTGSSKLPRIQVNRQDLRGNNYGKTWPAYTDHRVDANSFFGRMREKTGYGLKFDLPTEAQWEMAARDKGDGTYHGDYVWNDGVPFSYEQGGTNVVDWSHLDVLAWNRDQTLPNGVVHEVGTKLPGTNGLYDIHGNVWEYCLDHFLKNLGYDPVTDPTGNRLTSANFVVKGGSIYRTDPPANCRMATRISKDVRNGNCGFRLVIQF